MKILAVLVGVVVIVLVGADAVWRGSSATITRAVGRSTPVKGDVAIASAPLPPPVARFLERSVLEARGPIKTAQLTQEGEFFLNGVWKPMHAEQMFSASPPAFMWDARIRMAPLMSVYVRDSYLAGRATMQAKVLALYPVVNQSDRPELDAGALMRYLGEAAWLPTRLMPGDRLTWQPVDDHQAVATLTDDDTTVSLRFTFDDTGDLVEIYSPDRAREVNGSYLPTPWRVRALGHEVHDGVRLMSPAVAEWILPDGPLPYWRARITKANYSY